MSLLRQPLCEYCALIPFQYPEAKSTESFGTVQAGPWSLGFGKRVLQSACPFCCLVVKAFRRWRETLPTQSRSSYRSLSSLNNVRLNWRRDLTSDSTGGFTLNLDLFAVVWLGIAAPPRFLQQPDPCQRFLPRIGREFDCRRLSEWIRVCEKFHTNGGCPKAIKDEDRSGLFGSIFPGLAVIRFIDVDTNAVVELQAVPRYVALSYVWGEVGTVHLTTATKRELMATGALESAKTLIPQTISDAITLTRRLQCKYLWVDSLCLLQNDPDDLERGIGIMDNIYENAWLTIIAANGHNADAGLAGIQEYSRDEILATPITDELSMGVYVGLDKLLPVSVYASRAWTFQEQLLARRAVYFVDQKVFFRCRLETCSEQIADRYSSTQHPRMPTQPDKLQHIPPHFTQFPSVPDPEYYLKRPLRSFSSMIPAYSGRALSNQGDVIRAITGILRRIQQASRSSFISGTPAVAFDVFIVFTALNVPLKRRPGFPSYSWTGWKGRIDMVHLSNYPANMNRWVLEATWITWHQRRPDGSVDVLWDGVWDKCPFNDDMGRNFEWRQGPRAPFSSPVVSLTNLPTSSGFSPAAPHLRDYPLLLFWTLSVRYRLHKGDGHFGHIGPFIGKASMMTTRGAEAGVVFLDGVEENQFFESEDPFEFILLSQASAPEDNVPEGQRQFYVMLLQWTDGIAERRGIGRLLEAHLAGSFPPGPKWKEIVLG
ncbi:heterokaryon incompatibility protein-domain-containing protein [Echria macrotheca]|uniref:Heterokaryon incompatibility protein-domain-containing protein n=1 Tax=Echria macrotheca TaxID=438768 RepID=A0AAJ0BPY3_9PEZI|nr:heterokaryon incompatibility protein-domain-containing protein [Echria macrotheca]